MTKLFILATLSLIIFLLAFQTNPSEKNRARVLILLFLFQILLPQVFRQSNIGINSGGSSIFNFAMMGSWLLGTFLLCLFTFQTKFDTKVKFQSTPRKFILLSWVLLFMLEIVYDILSPTKILPLLSTFIFIIIFSIVFFYPIDSEVLLSEFTRIVSYFGFGLVLSYIFRVKYFGEFQEAGLQSDANYPNLLHTIFGLPNRISGPFLIFGGVQIAGLLFAFAQACNGLRSIRKNYVFHSLVLLIAGGSTGSRTFYLVYGIATLLTNTIEASPNRSSSPATRLFKSCLAFSIAFALVRLVSNSTSQVNQSTRSANGRTEVWTAVWTHWDDKSILGQGPQQFSEKIAPFVSFLPAHAHNSFFEYLWNFGIIGATGYFLGLFSLVAFCASNLKNSKSTTILLLIIFSVFSERTLRINMQDFVGLFWLIVINSTGSIFKPRNKSR
jgi:hypothetical protein